MNVNRNMDLFLKTSQFWNLKIESKLFEFLEQFIMDLLLIKLTQFGKTGSIGLKFKKTGSHF